MNETPVCLCTMMLKLILSGCIIVIDGTFNVVCIIYSETILTMLKGTFSMHSNLHVSCCFQPSGVKGKKKLFNILRSCNCYSSRRQTGDLNT